MKPRDSMAVEMQRGIERAYNAFTVEDICIFASESVCLGWYLLDCGNAKRFPVETNVLKPASSQQTRPVPLYNKEREKMSSLLVFYLNSQLSQHRHWLSCVDSQLDLRRPKCGLWEVSLLRPLRNDGYGSPSDGG